MKNEEMKTVVVTGGTRRIGRHIAEHLRKRGWRVITTSHRPDAGADLVADLTEPLGAARLYAAVLNLLGGNPPDALVNNAALFVGSEAALTAVNLDAPKKLTMMMAGRENGRGAVVNILDVAAMMPPVEGDARPVAYTNSKRELLDFTKKSAVMFAETIRVNAVAPGAVLPPENVHERAGETLLGPPSPEDVAAAVEFLLEANSTTGLILPVDGGASLLE